MKIALIQTNPIIGDLKGNSEKFLKAAIAAKENGADLAVGPELCLIGYPPKDLLFRKSFIDESRRALESLAISCPIPCVVGFAETSEIEGTGLFNSAAVLDGGQITSVHRKTLLPTYDVFDEARYFTPAKKRTLATVGGKKLGIAICEDFWWDEESFPGTPRYNENPIEDIVRQGPDVILNLSASPFWRGKLKRRVDILTRHARTHGLPIFMVNQVGGNDQLVFDGGSMVVAKDGSIAAVAKSFESDVLIADLKDLKPGAKPTFPNTNAETLDALVLGTRDYVKKCGFSSVCLGLSGGIDSALTAAVAKEALGANQVHGFALPSRYSSEHSILDARALAENLGIPFETIPIQDSVSGLESSLSSVFAGKARDVTEENIQARTRGVLLMSIANKFNHLLLTTGNKSEAAVGYCTLYGDMCGALAVLSDVPKTVVYEIALEFNRRNKGPIIPLSTLNKPPSAELRPDQFDSDTLPPYDVLDQILEAFIEKDLSVAGICALGFEKNIVVEVTRRVRLSEHKRFQAAPGIKVTQRAFGDGRRMPLAARWS